MLYARMATFTLFANSPFEISPNKAYKTCARQLLSARLAKNSLGKRKQTVPGERLSISRVTDKQFGFGREDSP